MCDGVNGCWRRLFLLSATLFSLLVGCRSSPPEKDQEIVIGSLLALTGQHQSFGITQKRGMDIAVGEINDAGGIHGRRLKIVYADTRLEEDEAVHAYNRLTREVGVSVIVGVTGSGVALRLAPRASRDNVVLLDSIDTSPRLTKEGGEYFFRNIASDSYSGRVLARWALGRGHRRAALVYNSEVAWATGCKSSVAPAFTGAGGTLAVDPIAVVDSTNVFSGPVAAIRNTERKVDAVFVCLMGRQAGLFLAQATADGLDVPFYGTDPFSQAEFLDNAKSSAANAFFVLPAASKGPRYEAFSRRYTSLYEDEPDAIAAKAYDAVVVLAEALRQLQADAQPLDGPNVRGALARVRVVGTTGENAFDDNGDLRTAAFERFRYDNRRRVAVE